MAGAPTYAKGYSVEEVYKPCGRSGRNCGTSAARLFVWILGAAFVTNLSAPMPSLGKPWALSAQACGKPRPSGLGRKASTAALVLSPV